LIDFYGMNRDTCRCLITGSHDNVEAAHIVPLNSIDTARYDYNLDVDLSDARNGVLLRRDLHAQFDLYTAYFSDITRIGAGFHYQDGVLETFTRITWPNGKHPSLAHLRHHAEVAETRKRRAKVAAASVSDADEQSDGNDREEMLTIKRLRGLECAEPYYGGVMKADAFASDVCSMMSV